MKVQFYSDIHADVNNIKSPEDVINFSDKADLYIDAGDTGSLLATRNFYNHPVWDDKNVVFVGGNHLCYGVDEPLEQVEEDLRNEFFLERNVSYLQNTEKDFGEYSVLGTTLWTDFNLFDNKQLCMNEAWRNMNDYQSIKYTKDHLLTPIDTANMFNIAMDFLSGKINNNPKKKFIIVTHHTPSIRSSLQQYRTQMITAAYCSKLEAFIEKHPNIVMWIHGHVHNTQMYRIGQTHILCNPLGYYTFHELSGFVPDAILEI